MVSLAESVGGSLEYGVSCHSFQTEKMELELLLDILFCWMIISYRLGRHKIREWKGRLRDVLNMNYTIKKEYSHVILNEPMG